MSSLFMADSNHRRLWSSERPIQQHGSYQMVSEPSPSTAILTTSIAPEGIAPHKIPLTEFSADLGTIIASIRHDFSRINSGLDRCIDHLNGSRATVLSESLHENPISVYSDMVYEPRVFLHDEVTVLFSEFHTQNMPCGMCVSPGVDTDEHHNNIYNESVKENNNHQVRSESMSSSGSIDIHETVVDTQSDSLVKILQEPQPKSTIASVLATTTESLKGVQALEIGSFENPNSTIDNGNLSCQGMEIAAEKLALDSGLRGVTDMIGAKQAKLELQEVVDFLMNPNKCTELEAKIPQDCLLLPACINQQLQEMDNELLHGFMTAIQQNYGDKDLIQFESFAMHNAFNLLAKYGTSHLIFNDGIQGKPSVVLTSTFLLDLRSACDVFVAMPNKVIPSYMHMGLLSFLVHELGAAVFRRRPPPEPPPIDQCLEALKTNAYCRSFSAFTFCFLFWVLYLFEEMPTRAMTFSFHIVVFDGGNNIHADLEDKVFGEGEYC